MEAQKVLSFKNLRKEKPNRNGKYLVIEDREFNILYFFNKGTKVATKEYAEELFAKNATGKGGSSERRLLNELFPSSEVIETGFYEKRNLFDYDYYELSIKLEPKYETYFAYLEEV